MLQECNDGWNVQVGGLICVEQPNNCIQIDTSDATLCSICDAGFTLNDDTKQCISCTDGSVLNCQECEYNSDFDHNYECTLCINGLIPFNNGQFCETGIEGCAELDPNDPTVCIRCIEGWNFASDRLTCTPCTTLVNDENCFSCSITPVTRRYRATCEECFTNYVLDDFDDCVLDTPCEAQEPDVLGVVDWDLTSRYNFAWEAYRNDTSTPRCC